MALTIFISVLCALLALCYFYMKRKYSYWAERGVPYQEPSLLFGTLRSVILQKQFAGDYFREVYKTAKGPFIGIYELIWPTLVICDAHLANIMLQRESNIFLERGFYIDEENDPMSINLVMCTGLRWRNARHKISGSLTSGKFKLMFPNMVEVTKPFIKYLGENAKEGTPVEIRNLACSYTSDFAASVFFGLEVKSIENPETPFKVICTEYFSTTNINGLRLVFLMFLPTLMKFLGVHFVAPYLEKYFTNLVTDIVHHRRANGIKRNDVMQLLMETEWIENPNETFGPKLRAKYKENPLMPIISHSFGLLLATFETSKTTIFFALYELVKQPEIQRRVQEELDRVLKGSEELSYELLGEAKYLDAVIAETLRLHPPLQHISRVCSEDYLIPGSDLTLKRGMRVMFPTSGFQTDEKYYPEPEKFKPERFLNGHKSFEEMPYLPFGLGPRHCVGKKLGELETKLFLAAILKNFEFYCDDIENVKIEISSKSTLLNVESDVKLNVRHRKNIVSV